MGDMFRPVLGHLQALVTLITFKPALGILFSF